MFTELYINILFFVKHLFVQSVSLENWIFDYRILQDYNIPIQLDYIERIFSLMYQTKTERWERKKERYTDKQTIKEWTCLSDTDKDVPTSVWCCCQCFLISDLSVCVWINYSIKNNLFFCLLFFARSFPSAYMVG